MSKPELLILDEPSLGLAPIIIEQIFEIIQKISHAGMSILVVEQHIHMALEIAQYAYIIESGRIVQHDSAAALLDDERVRQTYMGM
jgi:branched-chain amino acid transport system ATP-binding protein